MSSRYDSRTTTFSPEGRLYQVEYAVEAISQAGAVVGIRTKEGIVLAAEKGFQHALFDTENMQDKNISGEKVYKIADHIGCSVAGVTSDAYALLDYSRLAAHRHFYTFQEPIAVEDLCRMICDEKQMYTQYGGVRPFGVSFIIAGWDRFHGFQLFHTEPSGDYNAWGAYAIGQNDQIAQSILKKDWKEDMTLEEGQVLALRVLSKTMDTPKLVADRLEMSLLTRVAAPQGAKILNPYAEMPSKTAKFQILNPSQLKPFITEADRQREAEEAAEAEREKQQELRLEGAA